MNEGEREGGRGGEMERWRERERGRQERGEGGGGRERKERKREGGGGERVSAVHSITLLSLTHQHGLETFIDLSFSQILDLLQLCLNLRV